MVNEIWGDSDLLRLLSKVKGADIAQLAAQGSIAKAKVLTKLLLEHGGQRGVREALRATYRIEQMKSPSRKRRIN